MPTSLKYPTSTNAVQKTLDAALLAGATASVTLNSVTGIQNKAGVFVVDRVDANGTATPSKREYITFTGVSGSTLTGLTRNADGGGTDQDHAVGAIVEFVSDVLQEQAIIDGLLEVIDTNGALDTTKVVDLTTAQTLTNKTLTSPTLTTPVINTSFSGTAKATATTVAAGTNDDTIVTPLAVAPYGNYSMARQALINGNFDVWQRTTTSTNPASATYIADRWRTIVNYDGGTPPSNVIHSRQTQTMGDLFGSYYFYRINPDGAGSSFGAGASYVIQQLIENGVKMLCGASKKVTVSFWARSSIANKKIGVCLFQYYGTGGSPSASETISGGSWTLTSTWTKYTQTFTTNTLVGKTFGTNGDENLRPQIFVAWGSTNATLFGTTGTETFVGSGNIDIAQVQLCAGDVALPFQPKSFEEELRACQRYYCKSFPYATAPAQNSGVLIGVTDVYLPTGASGTFNASVRFPVSMRVAPTTFTTYNPSAAASSWRDTTNSANRTASSDRMSADGISIYGASGVAASDNLIHWTADAEI